MFFDQQMWKFSLLMAIAKLRSYNKNFTLHVLYKRWKLEVAILVCASGFQPLPQIHYKIIVKNLKNLIG